MILRYVLPHNIIIKHFLLLLSQVPDQPLQADITGLSPATNYSLAVTAHTNYGSHTGPVSYALTLDDGKFDVNIK